MYDFKEFEGEDKWERFEALRKKLHKDAINEYFEEEHNKAIANGENRILISFCKEVKLKDGSSLTLEEMERYVEENNLTTYPTNESRAEEFLRKMKNESMCRKH